MNNPQAKEYVEGLRERMAKKECDGCEFRSLGKENTCLLGCPLGKCAEYYLHTDNLLTEVLGDLEIAIDGELPTWFIDGIDKANKLAYLPIGSGRYINKLKAGYYQTVKLKDAMKEVKHDTDNQDNR